MSSHDGTLGLLGRVGAGTGGSAERVDSAGTDAVPSGLSPGSVGADAAGTAGLRPPRDERAGRRAAPVAARESVPASGNGGAAASSPAPGRITRDAEATGEPGRGS